MPQKEMQNVRYAYRIMMTEMCEIPIAVNVKPGCTQGFSEEPELMDEVLYDTVEDAEISLGRFRSVATGIVMDRSAYKIRGVREFYIEKIKVGENDRKLLSYGAVRYALFEEYEDYIPSVCTEPPKPVKRRKKRRQPVLSAVK